MFKTHETPNRRLTCAFVYDTREAAERLEFLEDDMHWPARGTDSTPTEPGWYWHRRKSDGVIRMRAVGEWPAGGLVAKPDGQDYLPVSQIGGQWVRVPEPDEWESPYANRDE